MHCNAILTLINPSMSNGGWGGKMFHFFYSLQFFICLYFRPIFHDKKFISVYNAFLKLKVVSHI